MVANPSRTLAPSASQCPEHVDLGSRNLTVLGGQLRPGLGQSSLRIQSIE
jgi:hypothetical protein